MLHPVLCKINVRKLFFQQMVKQLFASSFYYSALVVGYRKFKLDFDKIKILKFVLLQPKFAKLRKDGQKFV